MGRGMRAGKKPKKQKPNMQMAQMQAVQEEMDKIQQELDSKEITTTAGGGVVSVTMNGKKEILELNLEKDVVDPDDVEMLQDLIISAVNEGIRKVEDMSQEEMGKLTASFGF